VHLPGAGRTPSPWAVLVAVSALLLLGVATLVGVWWALSSQTRIASYRVVGELTRLELDLAAADVDIDGGGVGAVEVRRTDRFAFGHDAAERRAVRGGALQLRSRCPETVLGDCRTAYRITVPDNVTVTVRTTRGDVRVEGLRGSARVTTRSGAVSVEEFCGFLLQAASESGDVRAGLECSPDRLSLRSGSGDVSAVVPRGIYEIDAQSDSGRERVRGVSVGEGALFQIQALSGSGDVTVAAGP